MPSFQEGMFGFKATSIASRADINANNDGFSFYGKLWQAYSDWYEKKNAGAFPANFQFSDYKVANWNEQNVPDEFNDYVRPWIDDQWALA